MLHAVLKVKNLRLYEEMGEITKNFIDQKEHLTKKKLKKIIQKVN